MSAGSAEHYESASSGAATDDGAGAESHSMRARSRRRADWRQGGRSVRQWDSYVLAFALLGVGVGLLSALVVARIPASWASVGSSGALWFGMSAAVVFAFTRAVPSGLLRFRSIDVLWGLGVGVGLRLAQGILGGANMSAFPSQTGLDGVVQSGWWFDTALPGGLIGPLAEEFFFRAVVLVTVFQLLRRSVGSLAAGVTALLASAGAFVLLHAAFGQLDLAVGLQLFIVGAACASAVLLTGRIWTAVLVHAVYNLSFLLLSIAGTMLS